MKQYCFVFYDFIYIHIHINIYVVKIMHHIFSGRHISISEINVKVYTTSMIQTHNKWRYNYNF